MRIWRISNYADLSGEGGRQASARWHTEGRPVVYLSEHPALALLEILVGLEVDADDLPATYQLLEVDLPDDIADSPLREDDLSLRYPDWRTDLSVTRTLGDLWLESGDTAIRRVPSVILPRSENVLLNPLHLDARRVRILNTMQATYDPRLFRGAG